MVPNSKTRSGLDLEAKGVAIRATKRALKGKPIVASIPIYAISGNGKRHSASGAKNAGKIPDPPLTNKKRRYRQHPSQIITAKATDSFGVHSRSQSDTNSTKNL